MSGSKQSVLVAVAAVLLLGATEIVPSTFRASDPGVRGGPSGSGRPIPGLNANEQTFFTAGRDDFAEAEGVGDGLGPRFNLDSCGGAGNTRFGPSEANTVVDRFRNLGEPDKQHLLNFLRSL